MRFASLLLAGVSGLVAATPAGAGKAPAAPASGAGPASAPRPAPLGAGAGDALRRLCAAWPEGPVPLLQAPFRAPPLRYDAGALTLELGAPALVEDGPRGLVEILPSEADQARAPAAIEEGARLVRAQAEGQLEARIAFYPEREPLLSTACLSLSGGRVLRLRAQPLWISLLQDGREQARLYTDRGEGLAPEGRPDAQLDLKGLVFEGDGAELEAVRAALPPVRAAAVSCYQQALARRPDLAGRVILGADLDREGRAGSARVEVDTIGDAALQRCLREALAAARLPRLRRGGHLSLPLSLRRVPVPGLAGK